MSQRHSSRPIESEKNPIHRASLASARRSGLTIGIGLLALACASGVPPTPDESAQSTEGWTSRQRRERIVLEEALSAAHAADTRSGLVVRLAFDDGADLDLFVTDPLKESVYFGNSPGLSGGALQVDRRCEDPEPRIEEITYDAPRPGRYRIGVDHHAACKTGPLQSASSKNGIYAVDVRHGDQRWRSAGVLERGHFEIIVLEFEIEIEIESTSNEPVRP